MITFLPFYLCFGSCMEKETSKPKVKEKEKEIQYYYYEYEEGTVRCHIETNQIVTCLDVID